MYFEANIIEIRWKCDWVQFYWNKWSLNASPRNDVWTPWKQHSGLVEVMILPQCAHEAIQYSSTSLEGKGKSPRLWALGLDGLCNAARGLGGATSQQQTLPRTDQSGLTQENGWIWSRSWPTSFHCVEPFPCRKKKVRVPALRVKSLPLRKYTESHS